MSASYTKKLVLAFAFSEFKTLKGETITTKLDELVKSNKHVIQTNFDTSEGFDKIQTPKQKKNGKKCLHTEYKANDKLKDQLIERCDQKLLYCNQYSRVHLELTISGHSGPYSNKILSNPTSINHIANSLSIANVFGEVCTHYKEKYPNLTTSVKTTQCYGALGKSNNEKMVKAKCLFSSKHSRKDIDNLSSQSPLNNLVQAVNKQYTEKVDKAKGAFTTSYGIVNNNQKTSLDMKSKKDRGIVVYKKNQTPIQPTKLLPQRKQQEPNRLI
jgi:hypothetical protein